VKSIRTLTVAVALLLSASANAQEKENPFKFEFHGFVTGSLYMQNQTFGTGSGQGLLFFAPSPANAAPCEAATCGAGTATKSGTFLGGDVRQTRYAFALTGPKIILDATPKAYLEGDLFGGAGGGFLPESWVWRIRAAYAELKFTNLTLQAGQHSAQLAFAQMPDSVAHIANPLSFGAGNYGWRTLGARALYNIPFAGGKLELAGSVAQPSWGNNAVPGAAPTTIGSGMATNIPQVEARVKADGKAGDLSWMGYADVLYQQVDLKGFGETNPAGVTLADGSVKTSATSQAFEVGGKFTYASVVPVYLAFNVFTGKGLGSMAGALLQVGEIQETGYWASLGANLSKQVSLTATYGVSSPDEKDVRNWGGVTGAPYNNTNQKKDNRLMAGQLKWMNGGYALAAEYISYETTYLTGTFAAPGADIKTDGYQVITSAAYFF
jgi:hypothetical protein